MADPSTFKVDPSPANSAFDPTKLMGFVPLVDALLLSNPKPILQLGGGGCDDEMVMMVRSDDGVGVCRWGDEGGGVGCDVAAVPRGGEDVMAVVDLWCGDGGGGCVEMRWCGRGYDEVVISVMTLGFYLIINPNPYSFSSLFPTNLSRRSGHAPATTPTHTTTLSLSISELPHHHYPITPPPSWLPHLRSQPHHVISSTSPSHRNHLHHIIPTIIDHHHLATSRPPQPHHHHLSRCHPT
nr:hypothetical protein [Tanacetum cinerariifolium]